MRIGLLLSYNRPEELEKGFADLAAHGFDNCQLCSWNPAVWTDENAKKVRALAERYHVTVSAFWCGWEGPAVWNFYDGPLTLGLLPEEYRAMRVQNLCDGADFAKKLGVTDVITHMGFIPENPNDPAFAPMCDAIRIVAQHLKENGQYLLFETGQETPVAMLRCFETVGTGNLGVNLDTANLILYGKANPVDALDVIGRYVRNLHMKDGLYPENGHDLGHETPLGEGKVDFPRLLRGLKALGYDSWLTIEREISGEKQIADILAAKAYLESILNDMEQEDATC